MKASTDFDNSPTHISNKHNRNHNPQFVAAAEIMGNQLIGKERGPPIFGAALLLSAFLVFLLMGGRPPAPFTQVSQRVQELLQSALQETGGESVPDWATICEANFCLEGPNLKHARVMQPSHFFLHASGANRFKCYGRAAGPTGIFQLDMTVVNEGTVRVDFTPQQEGVYKLWISYELVDPWIPPEKPAASIFTPWLHAQTLPMSRPLDLTVLPNPRAPPRGCKPCRGPGAGTLRGQWVNRTELTRVCGPNVLGAMEEWVDDDFVWAARGCTFPFYSRRGFLEHFSGANILLAGDSTVRGHFINLQNWLWYGNGPETLQGPYETYDAGTYASSWDDHASGFNTPLWGFRQDMLNITPNPMEVGKVRIEYFSVTDNILDFEAVVRRAWENKVELAKYHYHATVLNYGLWSVGLGVQFSCQIPAFFRNIFRSLICRPKELRNPGSLHNFNFTIPPEEVFGYNKCSWRDYETHPAEYTGVHLPASDTCLERFPGRLVYRSGTARFDWRHTCVGNHTHPRTLCQLDRGMKAMVEDAFNASAPSWDGDPLLLDMFDLSTTRPDRSLDGYHFFPRKCLPGQSTERDCDETTWNPVATACCFKPNFAQIVSSTTTNMLISLLWDDPLLLARGR